METRAAIAMRTWLTAAFIVAAFFVQLGAAGTAVAASGQYPKTGHVYLFRGFINIFSLGMDELAAAIRASGVNATVQNHVLASEAARAAAVEYRQSRGRDPIFIAGHSLGADAAIEMASALEREGIPVALLITFDTTLPRPIPANVRHVVNFYQQNSLVLIGGNLQTAPGFRGRIENVDVARLLGGDVMDVNHFNIDKLVALHNKTVSYIQQYSRSR